MGIIAGSRIKSPERKLFVDDEEVLVERLDELQERFDVLRNFTLELLRRHPEEMLAFAIYGNPDTFNGYRDTVERRRQSREARKGFAQPVVYYVDRGDRIKIGTSTSIVGRLKTMHALPTDLLAVEPGGYDIEHTRHEEFYEFRIEGTELFRKGPRLMAHIAELADRYTDPLQYACKLNNLASVA